MSHPDLPALSDLRACYDYCRTVTHRYGPNFSVGFRVLPQAKRRAVYATYAFCRFADDIADEERGGDPAELLDDWESALDRCYRGETDHPVLVALADAAQRFDIPAEPFHRLIDGCRMDLTITRYETFDDLLVYCDKVASTISEMSLAIFGWRDENSHELGRHLSTALQLTNITRDVAEDWRRGRVYLPQEELRRFNCPVEDLGRDSPTDEFRALMHFQVDRALGYFQNARPLPDAIMADSRAAVVLMGGVYKQIAERIGSDVGAVLRKRVGMSGFEKLAYALRIAVQDRLNRAGLAPKVGW